MMRLRPLSGLILALVLALTSVTMAQARGQAMAVGQVVICSGGALVTVPVDAEGNPTGPAHICPDCALTLFAAPPATPPVIATRADWQAVPHLSQPEATPVVRGAAPKSARGPPFQV